VIAEHAIGQSRLFSAPCSNTLLPPPARGVFAFHVPNGGSRLRVEALIRKDLGVCAGVPDIIAVRDGPRPWVSNATPMLRSARLAQRWSWPAALTTRRSCLSTGAFCGAQRDLGELADGHLFW
jgi:hypothetical protein